MSDFTSDQLSEIKQYIVAAIVELRSCFNCQTASREVDDIWIGGAESDMYDLLGPSLEVPEEYQEEDQIL